MISFKKSTLLNSWTLPHRSNGSVTISSQILKQFKTQDFLVVDFLCQSYSKNIKGVILNEDLDFNRVLQVSAFLGPTCTLLKDASILILCPDDAIIKWHYFISKCGSFKTHTVTSNFQFDSFEEHNGIAFLISFSNIKLVEHFKEQYLFSIVIDDLDLVANKIMIRKLQGKFNIGLTSRNFYVDPDQNLQWSMLNWANRSCVGKLADFYQFDNDNFANLRDNYKEWWFRLTWRFCDSFTKSTKEEQENLKSSLNNWAKEHHLVTIKKTNIKSNKRKPMSTNGNSYCGVENNGNDKRKKIVFKSKIKPFKDSKKSCNKYVMNNDNNSKVEIDASKPTTSKSENEILYSLNNTASTVLNKDNSDAIDNSDIFLRSIVSKKSNKIDYFDRILNNSNDDLNNSIDSQIDSSEYSLEKSKCESAHYIEETTFREVTKNSLNIDDLVKDINKLCEKCD